MVIRNQKKSENLVLIRPPLRPLRKLGPSAVKKEIYIGLFIIMHKSNVNASGNLLVIMPTNNDVSNYLRSLALSNSKILDNSHTNHLPLALFSLHSFYLYKSIFSFVER